MSDKTKKVLCTLSALGLLASTVFSAPAYSKTLSQKEDPFIAKCRDAVTRLLPRTRVDKILKAPIDNLCELWVGNNVLYFYPDKGYLFVGDILTVKGKNLTQLSRERMFKEKLKQIDTKYAIKWGKGKVKVILFADPDCPFCARAEKVLLSDMFKDKIRVYVFLYPLTQLHPDARKHSIDVLCSSDPIKTLLAFAERKNPEIQCSKERRKWAENRLKVMMDTGKKIEIPGTPLVVVEDTVIFGADIERILRTINFAEKKVKNGT